MVSSASNTSQELRGYVVHWRAPSDEPSTIHFHPELLPFESANAMGKALSTAGFWASVTPVVCRDYALAASKIAGNQRVSTTPIELRFVDSL